MLSFSSSRTELLGVGLSVGRWKILTMRKINNGDIKAKLCIMASFITKSSHRTLGIDLHFCGNRAQIQRHIPLGIDTIEITRDPDLTIPRA